LLQNFQRVKSRMIVADYRTSENYRPRGLLETERKFDLSQLETREDAVSIKRIEILLSFLVI